MKHRNLYQLMNTSAYLVVRYKRTWRGVNWMRWGFWAFAVVAGYLGHDG
jgi:hypothetical protein